MSIVCYVVQVISQRFASAECNLARAVYDGQSGLFVQGADAPFSGQCLGQSVPIVGRLVIVHLTDDGRWVFQA